MPRQLGPTIRMPSPRTLRTSSSWSSFPPGPLSAKPAVSTTRARTPFSAQSSTTESTAGCGTAMTARSTGPGMSFTDGYAGIDETTSALGFTG